MKFGTDGVRGVANVALTPELVLALGRAAARVLPPGHVVIGRDTRQSGPMLEAALVAGLTGEGRSVHRLGVAPTPAVAWVAHDDGALGAVVSASHNPFGDNGVKFFAPGGGKLSDEQEAAVEAELQQLLASSDRPGVPTGAAIGTVSDRAPDVERWLGAVLASIERRTLEGLRVVVDCANGALSDLAPRALTSLGADVTVLHASPTGTNINDACGSNHPESLQATVLDIGADLGVAFDGDADRVQAVDAGGRLIDGDQLMAMTAIDLADRGLLKDRTVVVTVMTNLGFRRAMAERGIDVVEVPVGDRHVLAALAARRLSFGGEQSGHLVFADHATTGDGLLAAVQVLDLVARSGQPLGELADKAMTRLPQVLRNVTVARRSDDLLDRLAPDVEAVEAQLGDEGRVLLRPSGTEPLIRVMVEAPTAAEAEAAAERLVAAVSALS
ncbi:MAG: phosphoglucosamine mutase [Actinomycetota bacterium]|nr:phosphoglucosamine mutase [Actinomycetota bacterium]